MKKVFFMLACSLVSLGFVSCGKGSYQHAISVDYPRSGVSELFADQTLDSVCFYTFDSYRVTGEDLPWLSVTNDGRSPSSAILDNTYYGYYAVSVNVRLQPNTTGQSRIGSVYVLSYGEDFNETVTVKYYQTGWHDVFAPFPKYVKDENGTVKSAEFCDTVKANVIKDSICFTAYDKWELMLPESSFVSTTDVKMGNPGTYKIHLNMNPNESADNRSAELKLVGRGDVVTPIRIVQRGK